MNISPDAMLIGLVYVREELQDKQDAGTIEPHEAEQLAELNNGDLDRLIAEFKARRKEEGNERR